MKTRWLTATFIVLGMYPTIGRCQNYTERGAILGGLGGAAAGAAIGNKNDETAAGALIGGAIGLITGSAIGSAKDENVARQHAYQQHMNNRMAHAVSTHDVVAMTQNGVSDDVIINHIRQNGVQQRIQVSDVISLHQRGVSQPVIAAMQQAPLATAPPVVPRYRSPVIVEEHHYVTPPYYYRRPHFHHHHYHGPRRYYRQPGFSWGITFGN